MGAAVLDIGGEVGALMVRVPASFAHSEIEVRAVGEQWLGNHTAVRRLEGQGSSSWVALFPALKEGSYELRSPMPGTNGEETLDRFVFVQGGRVTEEVLPLPSADLRGSPGR